MGGIEGETSEFKLPDKYTVAPEPPPLPKIFETAAGNAGIPKEHWGKAEIQEFMQTQVSLDNIREDLYNASRNENLPPTLKKRCQRAELALRAVLMMLQAEPGTPTTDNPERYIAAKLRDAIADYDLKVVKKEPSER